MSSLRFLNGGRERSAGRVNAPSLPGEPPELTDDTVADFTGGRWGDAVWIAGDRAYLASGARVLEDALHDLGGVRLVSALNRKWTKSLVQAAVRRLGSDPLGAIAAWDAEQRASGGAGATVPRDALRTVLGALYGTSAEGVRLPSTVRLPTIALGFAPSNGVRTSTVAAPRVAWVPLPETGGGGGAGADGGAGGEGTGTEPRGDTGTGSGPSTGRGTRRRRRGGSGGALLLVAAAVILAGGDD